MTEPVATLNDRTYTRAELAEAAEVEARLDGAGSIKAAARAEGLTYHGFYTRCRKLGIPTRKAPCATA